MSEYQNLTPSQRAKMLNEDEPRYRKIKAEHDRAVERVTRSLAAAKTHAEYKTAREELERLERPAGFDANDFTASSGREGVVARGLRAG